MHTLGLIAGESDASTLLYEQHAETARADGASSVVCQERSHLPALRAALEARDDAAAEAALRGAGDRLRAEGATTLALCSYALHRFADALEAGGAPLLRIEDALGAELRSSGIHTIGFVSRSETCLLPTVRDRIAYEHSVELLFLGEDGAEEIDEAFEDLERGRVPDRPAPFWKRLERRWEGLSTRPVLFEREALAWHLTRHGLFARPTLSADRLHAQAVRRHLLGEAPPTPQDGPPTYVGHPDDR